MYENETFVNGEVDAKSLNEYIEFCWDITIGPAWEVIKKFFELDIILGDFLAGNKFCGCVEEIWEGNCCDNFWVTCFCDVPNNCCIVNGIIGGPKGDVILCCTLLLLLLSGLDCCCWDKTFVKELSAKFEAKLADKILLALNWAQVVGLIKLDKETPLNDVLTDWLA